MDKYKFDAIIDSLVKAYMSLAKELAYSTNTEQASMQISVRKVLVGVYYNALLSVYQETDVDKLPRVYREVISYSNQATCSSSRKFAVRLPPLDLNSVVQQLNADFKQNHQLSAEYKLQDGQKLIFTFILSDQPTLIQQLMALPKMHFNKFLIAAMITCAILAAVCSFTWLIPTALAAAGLFSRLKIPGHREKFYQEAVDQASSLTPIEQVLARF